MAPLDQTFFAEDSGTANQTSVIPSKNQLSRRGALYRFIHIAIAVQVNPLEESFYHGTRTYVVCIEVDIYCI